MTTSKKTSTKKKNSIACTQEIVHLDHSRVFPAACLTDGLFRPLRKGDQKKGKLDLQYKLKGHTLWWRNYEPLSIQEQSVFLALHRIAAEQSRRNDLNVNPETTDLIELRDLLKLELNAKNEGCGYVKTSLYEIAKIIGISDSGQNLNNIAHSLVRLSSVVCAIYKNNNMSDKYWQANLISHIQIEDKHVLIAINSMLSSALVNVPSSLISMTDQRLLKSDAAKRLHMWLSSWSHDGENKIGLDSLIPHVWGAGQVTADDIRNRRRYLRAALKEINELDGWTCMENDGMVTVIKPTKKALTDKSI